MALDATGKDEIINKSTVSYVTLYLSSKHFVQHSLFIPSLRYFALGYVGMPLFHLLSFITHRYMIRLVLPLRRRLNRVNSSFYGQVDDEPA